MYHTRFLFFERYVRTLTYSILAYIRVSSSHDFVCRCGWLCSDVPQAPVGLRVTGTNVGLISLAWDAPKSDGGSAVTGYIIEICRSGSTTGWTTGARVDGSCQSAELTGLSENDLYFVRVFSENQAGLCKKPCEISEPISAKKPLGKFLLI